MRYLLTLVFAAAVAGCATGGAKDRQRCADTLNAAWKELDLAKAQGFSGTVSYSKAAGLLTRAKANQVVEDFSECVDTAQRARFFIAESRAGR
jgi:hypothetical protein